MWNFGDDIFLDVLLAAIARSDEQARFSVIPARAVMTQNGNGLRQLPGGRAATLRALLRNDVWLFGGGGLIQDRTERSRAWLRKARWLAWAARRAGRKVAMVGMGVGPLETPEGRQAAGRLLDLADFLTVRDQESQAEVHAVRPGLEAPVTADLALTLADHVSRERRKTGREAPILGINLLAYSTCRGEGSAADLRMAGSVASVLDRLLEAHPRWRIKLIECFAGADAYSDAIPLSALRERLARPDRVSYHPYRGDWTATCREIATCSAFLGMRFHSCVVAYLAGLPFLMVDIQPKSVSLARMIDYPAHRLLSVGGLLDPPALAPHLLDLLGARESFARAPVAGLAAAAQENFTLLEEWLRGFGISAQAVPKPDIGKTA
jgi:polysaccharide pyruvyl transferase WcaK-like protein